MPDNVHIADLFGMVALVIFGFVSSTTLVKKFDLTPLRGFALYIWHTAFCFVYIWYVTTNGGDALDYYQVAIQSGVDFNVGTAAISFFTALFAKYLGLSFEATCLAYNIVGFIGLLALDGSLKQVTKDAGRRVRLLASVLVFLPSISFWSSAIGKDAIAFAATALALWASLALERRWGLMAFSVALMLAVRPHIAGLMVLALALAMVFQKRISIPKKLFFGAVLIAAVGLAVPFALQYAGLGAAESVGDFSDYVEARQSYNQEGGGGIDISQMSLPLQLFTYVFRPLPFEASGMAALAASFENMLLILFAVYAVRCWGRRRKAQGVYVGNTWFMLSFALMAWGVLAMTTANLGISLRQKWMFMPMLLYVGTAVMATANPGRSRSRWQNA